jgi:hypothetical protein
VTTTLDSEFMQMAPLVKSSHFCSGAFVSAAAVCNDISPSSICVALKVRPLSALINISSRCSHLDSIERQKGDIVSFLLFLIRRFLKTMLG